LSWELKAAPSEVESAMARDPPGLATVTEQAIPWKPGIPKSKPDDQSPTKDAEVAAGFNSLMRRNLALRLV